MREIGIDVGHRVTYHGSKCRNLHGHRYRVQAICRGPLYTDGAQQGMVVDFGFLKETMLEEIDAPCDHGTVLWADDPLLKDLHEAGLLRDDLSNLRGEVRETGFSLTEWFSGKLYLIPYVPTAENLAQHWFQRLSPRVSELTSKRARVHRLRVWETPNCYADYPPG